jgi:anti-sigma B factor antagonist
MALEIAQREREGIIIFDLKGRVTAGDEAGTFREAVEKAATLTEPRVILNLHQVEYIDSTGLGALVMCNTRLHRAGGKAKLLNLNRRNMELLVMTKIDTIFEAFDDEVDAINSFFPGREIRKFDILSFVQQMKKESGNN